MYKRLIFYGITISAIVLVYIKFSELRLLQNFFTHAKGSSLAGIIVIQFVTFLALAYNYQSVLAIKNLRIGVWSLFPITFVIQFISQALPTAGISGQVFFIAYLKKYGLTLAEGIGRAILEMATLYVAYAVFFVISAGLLFRSDVFRAHPEILFFVYAFLAFAGLCWAVVVLSQKNRRATWLHRLIDRFTRLMRQLGVHQSGWFQKLSSHGEHFAMVRDQFRETLSIEALAPKKWLFIKACLWQGTGLMTHVLTLYVISIALGHTISFAVCFIAFTFSKFLSMVSIIPGAPGVFEGAMVLILISFGVDKSVALAATLLTRAFTFWLPMPIGWMLYNYYTKLWSKNEPVA